MARHSDNPTNTSIELKVTHCSAKKSSISSQQKYTRKSTNDMLNSTTVTRTLHAKSSSCNGINTVRY